MAASPDETRSPAPADSPSLATTVELLGRARSGDERALDEVFRRTAPPLKRWARGRLPIWARDLADTDDLVQDVMIATLRRLDVFEYRTDAALHAYLRQAVINRIRNEIRRVHRQPGRDVLDSGAEAGEASPLEALIGRRTLEAYEAALEALAPSEREAVIGRVELGMTYEALATALGKPSADAARMAVGRALAKLARRLDLAPGTEARAARGG
jgi:RNA polymerase sigma factor (sigma-70 family)